MSVGQKSPFTRKEVRLIKKVLSAQTNLRDLVLFSVGIDSMLRASGLLKLKVTDLVVSSPPLFFREHLSHHSSSLGPHK